MSESTASDHTGQASGAGVRWDLTLVAKDVNEVGKRFQALLAAASSFAERFSGRVAALSAMELAALLEELGFLQEELRTLKLYGELRLAAKSDDAEARDLSVIVERDGTEVENLLRFVELEWLGIPERDAERLLAAPALASWAHWLRAERRFAPYKLLPAEEKIMALRKASAQSAWQELHQEQMATIEVPFDAGSGEEPHSLDRLLSYAHSPIRALRERALKTAYAAVELKAPILAGAYNALVGDRLTEDQIRSRGTDPMLETHLLNQLEPEDVEAMLAATERHQEIARRWYRAKGKLLGIDSMKIYDVYAPLGDPGRGILFDDARALVLESFNEFAPRLSELAQGFFADRRIDAEARSGKTGGAFAAEFSRTVKPFILLNHTDRLLDATTLAHELGHGTQYELTQAVQPPLVTETGLALAEVPSTFAEYLVFGALLKEATNPQVRLHLLSTGLDAAFATIFRQSMMARFELAAYRARAEGRALRPERLNELWLNEQRDYFGDAVEIEDWAAGGWSYIPHFIWTRFYTYAYSFARLCSLALYSRYQEDGEAFAAHYLDFLARGGSASPAEQLGDLGLDVADPETWERSFQELERLVEQALEAAALS